ncbi:MAG: CheR family methyltransferase [Burkholderiaceae bacterium]
MTARPGQPRLVVGVGASAGGLDAFRRLLGALPVDGGMSYLLVQHWDPAHEGRLADLLAPCTTMPVRDADDGAVIEPDTVYILHPKTTISIRDGRLALSPRATRRGVRLPVDHLFRALAHEYGSRAVGIVLSGAGSDGSSGVRDIKLVGGLNIAQEPDTCGQAGMPRSVIETGVVDLVLDIRDMPPALARFASIPADSRIDRAKELAGGERVERLRNLTQQQLDRLAEILEAESEFDLRVYKPGTVERRVLRRMALSDFDDPYAYFELLRGEPAEQQMLLRDLLISVTEFFRDPQAFDALRQMVVEPMVAAAPAGATLRAWIPGCASGEEAYSIAIEILDAIDNQKKRLGLQIFATDVDEQALSVARAGVYPESIVEQIPEHRLRTHFKRIDGQGYQVNPSLRGVVSFATHDLTKDPPFSHMNLVSCRNVLIYLTALAQQQVLKVMHFALEADGHLFLSTSESTSAARDYFETISKSQRIYRKVGVSRPVSMARSRHRPPAERAADDHGAPTRLADRQGGAVSELVRHALADTYAPPTLVVRADGIVVYAHGDLERFVRVPRGDNLRFEIGSVLRPEIATRARGALYKCRRDKAPVSVLASPDTTGARTQIHARPAPSMGDDVVMLSFESIGSGLSQESPARVENPEQEAIIDQLEKELQATREDLRNTVEELETTNEQLRTSNEESMSMNEELQSANEELEATTEELRSLNEELTTINAQFQDKIAQLEQTNHDLNNFFSSTKITTVFFDERLCIKRFTPTARDLLGIDQADVGRFVGDIARELLQNGLERDARGVLEDLGKRRQELHLSDGRWILREVLPYRTEGQRIEGIVVTFTDITAVKSTTAQLALRERQQGAIARMGLLALRETELRSYLEQVVLVVQQTLETEMCKILELQPGEQRMLLIAGVGWGPGMVGSEDVTADTDTVAGYTLRSGEAILVEDFAEEKRFAPSALLLAHGVTSGLSCTIRNGEQPYGVIGVYSRRQRSFTREDTVFLQAVADALGSAISRFQSRMRNRVELAAAQVLADASNLEDTMPRLLEQMAPEFPATVAEVWWKNADGRLYRRWLHTSGIDRELAERKLAKPWFEPGEGLVGRVYEDGSSAWRTTLAGPALVARLDAALELGLTSAFGLPICTGGEVLGVMTLLSTRTLSADDGLLRGLDAVGRSIGDFVARAEVESRMRELAAITESSHDAIVGYRLDGTVTEWLPGAERLFGYTSDDMVGHSIERIVPQDRRRELSSINKRIQAGEIVEPVNTTRICRDGRVVHVSERSSPVVDRRGRVIGITSTDRDITLLKETEDRLVEADRQKDEFLATLGHELRNPLAAIRSAAELLGLTRGGDSRLERIHTVLERQSQQMGKLLDGLLDVSRIMRGKIQLDLQTIDLAKLYGDFAVDIGERLQGGSVDLSTEIPAEPVWIEADPVRIMQIADNLASNAVQHTPEGGLITLSLRREDDMAVMTVRDNGMGIDAELLPHIFEMFRQSQQKLDRSHGGLGIGLALVKMLAEIHGGRVEARSQGPGKGAEFQVWLPISRTAGKRPDDTSLLAGALDIVLIEDNFDSGEMLKQVLERSGHHVSLATDAHQGIEMAIAQSPDVVLSDIGLPGDLSGFDVARILRADEHVGGTWLIALTGYGRPDDQQRCREAGFDVHLTKPIDIQSLLRLLDGLQRNRRP